MNRTVIGTWSLFVLFASVAFAQEDGLAVLYTDAEHEIEIRPPAGWRLLVGSGPVIVKFIGDREKAPAKLNLLHYFPEHPVPPAASLAQIKAFLEEEFKKVEIISEETRTIGGRVAGVVAFRTDLGEQKWVVERTLVHRSHREYYIVDYRCLASFYEKLKPLVRKSIDTLRVRPMVPSIEERAARSRARDFVKGGNLGRPELGGESWQGLVLGGRKTGWQREKLTPATVDGREGFRYEFESELAMKKAGKSRVSVRGSFTRDGSFQEIEGEHVLSPTEKEVRTWKYTMTLRGTELKVRRTLPGFTEEKSLRVPPGALLKDLVSVFRRSVVFGEKETYLVSFLDPFRDGSGVEWLEVEAGENLKVGEGPPTPGRIVFAKVDRRGSMTYYYRSDGTLLQVRSGAAPFRIVAMSREEALAK
jgi:hypothetical protein